MSVVEQGMVNGFENTLVVEVNNSDVVKEGSRISRGVFKALYALELVDVNECKMEGVQEIGDRPLDVLNVLLK